VSSPLVLDTIDFPKSLKSLTERDASGLRVDEPHVSPLTQYVRQIREATGMGDQIPFSILSTAVWLRPASTFLRRRERGQFRTDSFRETITMSQRRISSNSIERREFHGSIPLSGI
jgi:hypothetical protein